MTLAGTVLLVAIASVTAKYIFPIGFKAPPIIDTDDDEAYSLALLGFHRITSSLLHETGDKQPELLKGFLTTSRSN